MSRVTVMLLVFMAVGLGLVWINATKLPQWYQADNQIDANDPVAELTRIIQKQGLQVFFKDKLLDLLAGKLRLDEEEFNALLLSSLAADDQGQQFLSVTDVIKTRIDPQSIEIGAVISLEKLKAGHSDLAEKLGRLLTIPGIKGRQNIYMAITGRPNVAGGELVFDENVGVKIGDLIIPEPILGFVGLSDDKLRQQTLAINKLYIKDIELLAGQIDMVVSANF